MTATHTAYLALGSNVGDRLSHFREAVQLLRTHEAISVPRVSGVYETEPVGVRDQLWFLNAVVEISTTLPPLDLLSEVKRIEGAVGRTPTYRWGPREIDLDILLYEGVTCSDEVLTIPHPRMAERLFVLLPLRDLCPGWVDPRGKSIERLIEELEGTAVVRPCPQEV